MKQKKLGTLLGYLYTALQAAISIVYIPVLLQSIGGGEYGLYQVVGSVIAYFSVMESSLSASILRYYVLYKAEKNQTLMENTLAIGRRIFRVLSIVILVLLVPCTFILRAANAATFSPWELQEATLLLAFMAVNMLISMNGFIYIAAINAYEHYIFLKLSSLIGLILQPIAVILLIQRWPYAYAIVGVQLVLNIGMNIARWWYARHRLHVTVKLHHHDKALLKGMFNLSAAVLLVALADQIFWKTDQLILSSMYGTDAVATYAVGAQLNSMYISIACVLGGMLLPTVAKVIQTGDAHALSDYFARIGRYQSFLVGLMLSGVIAFGREFVLLIAGEARIEAYSVALLLMLPYSIELVQTCAGTIMQMKNQYHYRAAVMFSAAVINLGLTYWLAGCYGILGAALSTTVTILLTAVALNLIYYFRMGLDIGHFFRRILPVWGGAVLAFAVSYGINKVVIANGYLQFAVHVLLYTAIYGGIMYFLVMNKEERNMVNGFKRRFR